MSPFRASQCNPLRDEDSCLCRDSHSAPRFLTPEMQTPVVPVFVNGLAPPLPLARRLGDKVLLSPHMISSNVGSGLKPGIVWATRSAM